MKNKIKMIIGIIIIIIGLIIFFSLVGGQGKEFWMYCDGEDILKLCISLSFVGIGTSITVRRWYDEYGR